MSTWHRFQETESGDDECDRCAVVVAPEAHLTFTLVCPAGDCLSGSNPDRGCVFAPGRAEVAACVYCGRPGVRDGEAHAPDPAMDALTADLLE